MWMMALREADASTVALQHAVLCAECDVVSDSPHDACLVCGSRSVFNIAHMFGGNLPQNRTAMVPSETMEVRHEVVLSFPRQHGRRLKASG